MTGLMAAPFCIGSVEVPNRVALAPMAGISQSAFRLHMKRHGVGLVASEMVSAYGLKYRNQRTWRYVEFREEERPLALQLFGDTGEVMVEALELILEGPHIPDIIDINMGCPVRKVMKTGAGSALMADPERAEGLARAVVGKAEEMAIPVTVKMRSGLVSEEVLAVELARRMEASGVAALGVHPRAAEQLYRGHADHGVTAAVVEAVGIPVLASGDVKSWESASRIREETGAAAVMVGREARGNPWVVRELLVGEDRPRPPRSQVVRDLRNLMKVVGEDMGPDRAVRWMRRFLAPYLRPSGVPGVEIDRLRRIEDFSALDEAVAELARGG